MTADLTAAELERMRRVAEGATPGPWETYESIHAETFVCEEGRSMFGVVSKPATGREDYGRANAEHIATFDPPTVLALLDRIEAAEARVARVEALAREWSEVDVMDEYGEQRADDGHALRDALGLLDDCQCRDCEYARNPSEPMTVEEMAESAARSVQAFIEMNRRTSAAMAKAMDRALRGDT